MGFKLILVALFFVSCKGKELAKDAEPVEPVQMEQTINQEEPLQENEASQPEQVEELQQ